MCSGMLIDLSQQYSDVFFYLINPQLRFGPFILCVYSCVFGAILIRFYRFSTIVILDFRAIS